MYSYKKDVMDISLVEQHSATAGCDFGTYSWFRFLKN